MGKNLNILKTQKLGKRIKQKRERILPIKISCGNEDKKPKQLETLQNTSTSVLPKPSQNAPRQLLLAYTYFLSHFKYISVGYCCTTFLPKIIFGNVNYVNTCIELNVAEWYKFFMKLNKIYDYLHSCKYRKPWELKLTNTLNVRINKANNKNTDQMTEQFVVQIFRSNNNEYMFSFKIEEFIYLCRFSEFLNAVLKYMITSTTAVKKYFDLYKEKCDTFSLPFLDYRHFFKPVEGFPFQKNFTDGDVSSYEINYSRLFYEIPLLCKN